MAAMHATFWGFTDDGTGCSAPGRRYQALTPGDRAPRAASAAAPTRCRRRWRRRGRRCTRPTRGCTTLALALVTDPAPLVAALAETPATFVHGDWKAGNLGAHPDGRTILLDWGWPGATGPLVDVGWYLAVNCDRLPESKEDDDRGVPGGAGVARASTTGGWWDRQLSLALLGGVPAAGLVEVGRRSSPGGGSGCAGVARG